MTTVLISGENDNSSDIKKEPFGMITKQEGKFTPVTLKFLLSKS